MLNGADAERAGLRLNRGLNEISLRAARRFDLSSALLEFAIGAAGDGEEVIKPREKIMFAVVPALGALLQDVVVILFPLLIQRVPIARDFLLGTVFGAGVAENERAQTVGSHGHAFDAVGRFNALQERHFAQGFEHRGDWRV